MTEPKIAAREPIAVDVEAGKTYFWCTCGQSGSQPFCDGSHKDSSFTPMKYQADVSGTKYFCCCKQTTKAPFCDGTHNRL